MRVLLKEPYQKARMVSIPNNADFINRFCGGHIDYSQMDDAVIISNRYGILDFEEYNCTIGKQLFFGRIILAGLDSSGLTDWPFSIDVTRIVYPELFEVKEVK